tara:strand:- start:249 stop:1235 length:987 start_codon:yes stop_codon:yes gene_type:complete
MIVITGGAGFIGSNLVAALEQHCEEEIVICDYASTEDKWRNVSKRKIKELITPDKLLDWISSNIPLISTVFHLGAISSTVERNVDLILANNYRLSCNLWEICAQHNVKLIYASSAAVYGDGSSGFDDDLKLKSMSSLKPLNPYGWSKFLFDRKVAHYINNYSEKPRNWAGLRFFNVYGPNEYHKGNQRSVVPQFWEQIKQTGQARLFKSQNSKYADGNQMRDFIHVEDCVSIMIWLYDSTNVSGIFNVGTGKARTFEDMAKAIFKSLGVEPNIKYVDMPKNILSQYQYHTEARTERLRLAGYNNPFISLEDGIHSYVNNYLECKDPFR